MSPSDINQEELVLTLLLRPIQNKKIYVGPWASPSETGTTFQPLFANDEECKSASLYLMNLFERLVPEVANYLNQIHNKQFSNYYWRILIAPWLMQYLQIVYCHYQYINRYRDSALFVQIFKINRVPFDTTRDFIRSFQEDFGHHYIFSLIIDYVRPQNWKLKYCEMENFRYSRSGKINDFKRECGLIVKRFLFSLLTFRTATFFEAVPGLNFYEAVELSHSISYKEGRNTGVDLDDGSVVQMKFSNDSEIEFEKMIRRILFFTMPSFLKEGYWWRHFLANVYHKIFCAKKRMMILGPITGGYDPMKFIAGLHVENKGTLSIVQHGCSYGIAKAYTLMPAIEYYNAHSFISWGWHTHEGYRVKALPLSIPSLSKMRMNKRASSNQQILFVGACMLKYVDRISTIPQCEQWTSYREDKIAFLRELDQKLRSRIFYRPYPDGRSNFLDYAHIKLYFPDIIEVKGSLKGKFHHYSLVVIDHPGTMFLEMIAMNKAVIGFWNQDFWSMTSEAKSDFEILQKVGIVHPTPISAAIFLKTVCQVSIESWWNSLEVQAAVSRFSFKYARTSPEWKSEWQHAFSTT